MKGIVFYDGDCGLCQRSVYFLVKLDTRKELSFAPLNGVTYKKYFQEESPLTTVVYYSKNKLYTKSEAVIEVCRTLGGIKKVALILKIIPRFLRDRVYDFIASQRKKVSCIILPKDARFLN